VDVGGRQLERGERLTLMWASANRDEAVFGDPDEFRLDRRPEDNLLYGDMLTEAHGIALAPGAPPNRTIYPASGFSSLPVVVR
jgi:cytochrome P450